MKFNNDYYEEENNSGPNMTLIYMVLIMSTVVLGVLAIVLWTSNAGHKADGSGYAKALAQKAEREQQTTINEGAVPSAASSSDTIISGSLTSDQLDIWTLPDTGRKNQSSTSGRNNGTVTNQTTGETVIEGNSSKNDNTKTATADELAKGKTSVYDMTEKEDFKEDEKDKSNTDKKNSDKKESDKKNSDDKASDEEDEDNDGRTQITHADGTKEWVDIDEDIKKNSYDLSNLKYQEPIMRYYSGGNDVSHFGVDISSNAGEIDFEKLKNAGCEFCMIKIGARGYSSGNIIIDDSCKDYLEGAKKAGIKTGAYFCSQAVSKNEAREEVEELVSVIEDYSIKYPVAFVMENIEDDMARIEMLDTEERTKIAKTFMEEVKDAGYTPMIYGDKEWLMTMLDIGELEKYDVWYAQDGSKPDYPYQFGMWQYKSEGKVNGITENVPLIMSFNDYSK